MNQEKLLTDAEAFAKKVLEKDSSGHDWWHIYRVTKNAIYLANKENADGFICQLAALLHDIADEKLNDSEEEGLQKVENWLRKNNADNPTITHVMEIISTMSFKGGARPPMKTLEGRVVQDADRLDALGAIGIARTFAFAGAFGDAIFDPTSPPRETMSKEEYRNGKSTAINHFYEKLLRLKELMNTVEGKRVAATRHKFMERYLSEFYKEWNLNEVEEKENGNM